MFRTYQKNDFAYFVSLILNLLDLVEVCSLDLLLTGSLSLMVKQAYMLKWIPFLWFSLTLSLYP